MGCLEGGVLSFLLAKVLARDQHSLFFISGKGVIVWSFVLIVVFSYCMLKDAACVRHADILHVIAESVTERRILMYSPKIQPEQVRKLYLLKMSYVSLQISKPMTEMVREALSLYLPKAVKEILKSGGTLVMVDELTGKE